MKIGCCEHVSSLVAKEVGLQWTGRKMALRDLGPTDRVTGLFFVSTYIDLSLDEYIYLIDHLSLLTMFNGIRCKIPAFHFNSAMVSYLEHAGHRYWYIAVNGELVRIREMTMTKLSNRLNINLDEDIRHCFDQLFIHSPVEARQTYMPQRGKTPRLKWS